jgi:hypothetical protein
MTTISDIESQGLLQRFRVQLYPNEYEERAMYITPNAQSWLQTTLPTLVTSIAEGKNAPDQQIDEFFHDFISGEKLICSNYRDLREITPLKREIWELKTPDIRIIGWFYTKKTFICTDIDSKNRIQVQLKQNNINLYDIYSLNAVRIRDSFNLSQPISDTRQDINNELCF